MSRGEREAGDVDAVSYPHVMEAPMDWMLAGVVREPSLSSHGSDTLCVCARLAAAEVSPLRPNAHARDC